MLDKTKTIFTVIRNPRKAGKAKVMLRRQNRLVSFIRYRTKTGDKEYYLFYYAFK